ncbi:MAG: hypothetical protein IJS90_01015 [Clostridia bacterium]|nr:hypothetical protein [Clostridia bacterium]
MNCEYKLSVPLMNLSVRRQGREKLKNMLLEAGADRVFLALGVDSMINDTRSSELNELKENCAYFHSFGFEVGAWLWAFQVYGDSSFVRMTSPDGRASATTVCPTDLRYREKMGDFICDIAGTGVDLIMFDDDMRYGFQDNGFCCVCKNHIAIIEEELGEKTDISVLREHLLNGKKSKYRSAFLKANGRALEEFAADMRKALDSVSPDVRLGFCACITSWDIDGTCPDRVSRALAGDTKPFYRLIGAPYWASMKSWGNSLCDVIDAERAEAARRSDETVEIFSEGDTYPRPRFATPASYLECFDTALRAAGCTDGILKYMIDYKANAEYETGYFDAAVRNKDVYREIDMVFSGKKCEGIRVFDKADRYEAFSVPEKMKGKTDIQDLEFSASSRFLSKNSIPHIYEGEGSCGIAFGEDAGSLCPEDFKNGMILDACAARILTEAGVDVGIKGFGEPFKVKTEFFVDKKDHISVFGEPEAFMLSLAPGAKILSESSDQNGKTLPLSFVYENADKRRFLVYAFDGWFNNQNWFFGYHRARQIESFCEYAGKPLTAVCPGHPELYILVKRAGNRVAVGLWNLFADPVVSPRVFFPHDAEVLSSVNCNAKADGMTVTLSDIPAFGFAFFEVNRQLYL